MNTIKTIARNSQNMTQEFKSKTQTEHFEEYRHFALDEDNNFIDIKNVPKRDSNTKSKRRFFCPSCRKEMIARQGNKRRHHFAHKANQECPYDNYLHSIAEKLIMDWFNKQKSIILTMNIPEKCANTVSCNFYNDYCIRTVEKDFDLKKYYKKCTKEKEYKSFRADIYCECKYPDKPIFIEIFVTHECDKKKIESGIRIIEFKIESEKDILEIIKSNQIKENEKTRLYNFKREEQTCNDIEIPISKFILYPSQKSFVDNSYTCKNYDMERKGIYEISVPEFDEFVGCGGFYLVGKTKAFDDGYLKKDCQLCFWKAASNGDDLCKLYKKYGKPKYCKDNISSQCQHFKLDKDNIKDMLTYLNKNKGQHQTHIWKKKT